ncbi:MAG TPA: hypothetical protein VJP45_01435, partial [Candidatus Limnocylindria bacterium]|nr:hypothetical protein [Candidatus Limnocylindria bacterium]
ARVAATEAEAWDVRLTALATLGQYDALTFVVNDAQPRTTYNLDEDPVDEPRDRSAAPTAS